VHNVTLVSLALAKRSVRLKFILPHDIYSFPYHAPRRLRGLGNGTSHHPSSALIALVPNNFLHALPWRAAPAITLPVALRAAGAENLPGVIPDSGTREMLIVPPHRAVATAGTAALISPTHKWHSTISQDGSLGIGTY